MSARTFTYRSARSRALLVAILAVIAIETAALHFLFVRRHPMLAWSLTVFSVLTAVWLISDYRAMATNAVRVDDRTVQLKIGRRFDIGVERAIIARVIRPTFRDLPAVGTTQGADFLNLTRPASPNVLLVLSEPTTVSILGVHKRVTRLALHLDDPDAFIQIWSRS